MSRRTVNGVLSASLLAALLLYGVMGIDPATPNWELFPDMAHSARADAFAASEVLPDGATLQPPPPGTVPRGLPPLHLVRSPEDAVRTGEQLVSPLEPAGATERGGAVFATFCQPCHGAGGRGDGPVAQRGYPPPPSLLAEHARSLPAGQLFHIVTVGQGNMPGHAAQIAREDRWKVASYIRWLQSQSPSPDAAP